MLAHLPLDLKVYGTIVEKSELPFVVSVLFSAKLFFAGGLSSYKSYYYKRQVVVHKNTVHENRIIFGPIYLFRVGSDWKDIKVNKNDLVVAKCVTPLQMFGIRLRARQRMLLLFAHSLITKFCLIRVLEF